MLTAGSECGACRFRHGGRPVEGVQDEVEADLELATFLSTQRQADLETLRELAEAGRLAPAVGQAFPLSDAPAAIACFAQGQARGKIAITI